MILQYYSLMITKTRFWGVIAMIFQISDLFLIVLLYGKLYKQLSRMLKSKQTGLSCISKKYLRWKRSQSSIHILASKQTLQQPNTISKRGLGLTHSAGPSESWQYMIPVKPRFSEWLPDSLLLHSGSFSKCLDISLGHTSLPNHPWFTDEAPGM